MDAALISGAFALLVWFLSRLPGLSDSERRAARIERDLRILEKLPDGSARTALAAEIEQETLQMLLVRSRVLAVQAPGGVVERWTVGIASALVLVGGAFVLPVATIINPPDEVWIWLVVVGMQAALVWAWILPSWRRLVWAVRGSGQ